MKPLALLLLLFGCSVLASPKTDSMKRQTFSVPLVTVQVTTNTVGWFNPASLIPVTSNTVRTVVIGTTQTNTFSLPKTRTATIIGPSNELSATVFQVASNGIMSPPSNTITNSIGALPPAPPQTNVYTITPLFSTNLNGPYSTWTNSGAWSTTNPTGQMFFKFGIGVTKQ